MRISIGDPRQTTAERSFTNSASFNQIMNSHSKEITQDHFQKMLKDIDKQGLQLSETPNFNELRKYKTMVKRFMEEVTQKGVGLYQTESWDPYGGNKTLKTIQVLDKKLVELTNNVLHQQNEGLSILERIGEIKGLLINLYM
jgi:uncharacterized protein